MAVRVGNSYVTQQAYDYAKAKIDSEKSQGSEKNSVLEDLSKQYPETTFAAGTKPGGKGTNNITIAPDILRKMENDPEARLEYEALIYDCAELLKNEPIKQGDSTIIARGFVINEDGSLSGWSVGQTGGGEKTKTYKKVKKDEVKERLEKIREKKAEEKKIEKKAVEKKTEKKNAEKKAEEKKIAEKSAKQSEGRTFDIKV